ncbi:MAG: methyltransferase domain-containing protein, partial [Calditrichaeota bacterium]|nr:methyltransferase domain-containing protein [Calditrichota bacterium]
IADVVISNCVMNLVQDKEKAFNEVYRVLKEGGHFSISDIVHVGELPKAILEAAEMHAGCVAGASEKSQYLGMIKNAGFKDISIKKERRIELLDQVLLDYVSPDELEDYKASNSAIYSITVYAEKNLSGACCESTETSCCGSEKTERSENQSICCS